MAQVVDYRVSTLVVLCKDCGQDVGLYPARHKCQSIERPPMPTIKKKFLEPIHTKGNIPSLDTSRSSSVASSPIDTPTSSSKWSRWNNKGSPVDQNEDSIYFNNFAANLPEQEVAAGGKKTWGKGRQNDKWKQLNEKVDKTKQNGNLWGKIMQATQNMATPIYDEKGAESDEDDWEGETHVSRILREYYEKKRSPLPNWLFDKNTNKHITKSYKQEPVTPVSPVNQTSRRRLWEKNPDEKSKMSSRERELQELRQKPSVPKSSYENEKFRDEKMDRSRTDDHYFTRRQKEFSNKSDYLNLSDTRRPPNPYGEQRKYNYDDSEYTPKTRYENPYGTYRHRPSSRERKDPFSNRNRFDKEPDYL
ncbi:hypothetical protein K501DRAFT_246782 [Backusella circina FSU 941]|nr:hypothetical protein K501DRAFT_246782 [Backusella circina FSU 941]